MNNASAPRRGKTEYALSREAIINAVRAAGELERMGKEHLAGMVEIARILGTSWEDIGAALGCTRQAAQQRFGSSAR